MTVRPFELVEPPSLQAASAILEHDPNARAIAGGTALLIMIKHGLFFPETLVSLQKTVGSASIAEEPTGEIRIGALATLHDIERDPLIRARCQILAEASHVVANIRIRNAATIGGNLSHADSQSDPPIALSALGARVELVTSSDRRELPLSEFHRDAYETALRPGELVSAVIVPDARWQAAYVKFTTRSSEDRPAAGVAALLQVEGNRCTDVRLVVGAMTPTPVRLASVEELVRGRELDRVDLSDVGVAAQEAIDPPEDIRGSARYKRLLAGALVERALERCMRQWDRSRA